MPRRSLRRFATGQARVATISSASCRLVPRDAPRWALAPLWAFSWPSPSMRLAAKSKSDFSAETKLWTLFSVSSSQDSFASFRPPSLCSRADFAVSSNWSMASARSFFFVSIYFSAPSRATVVNTSMRSFGGLAARFSPLVAAVTSCAARSRNFFSVSRNPSIPRRATSATRAAA